MTEVPAASRLRHPFPTGSPPTLKVVPWPNPALDAQGHRPGSPYVLAVWLGILGPSTTLCWSRLSGIGQARPQTAIDVTDLARSLGLGAGLGRNAPITRTLSRMVMFGAAIRSGDTLAVRPTLPDVPERMAARLSYTAQLAHRRWASRIPEAVTTPALGAPAGVRL